MLITGNDYMNYSVLMSVCGKDNPVWLKDSIDSILKQTIPTDDFVIVCDGSLTVSLDKVLADYAKTHPCIHIFRLKNNEGLGRALAFGVKQCKNELVARMDSDDISIPERCEKQLNVFAENAVALVGGQIIEFYEDPDEPIALRDVPNKMDEIIAFSKMRNPFNHVSVMFKKEAVLQVGNYQDMPYREDYFLWIRMIEQGYQMINVSEPLVYVRTGEEMYKRRSGSSMRKSCIAMTRYMKKSGYISSLDFFKILSIWLIGASIPWRIRKKLYENKFRKSVE